MLGNGLEISVRDDAALRAAQTGSLSVHTTARPGDGEPAFELLQTRVRVQLHTDDGRVDTSSPDATPPRTFGRYRLIDAIGRGGMGVVYRAWDPDLRREVAVKVIRTDRRKRKAARRLSARLAREAQVLARLTHPNVVPVYDVGFVGGAIFVAMAYLRGTTLRRWMATPRSIEEIVNVFAAAGHGLAAAHRAGVIHRDFKPGNVLVTDDARIYVADFGLACAERHEDTSVDEPPTDSGIVPEDSACARMLETLTDDNAAIGTLPYMAPEQHLGRALDPTADQYAFCIALYEALYGSRPFAGTNSRALLALKIRSQLPVLSPSRRVPHWLHRIVAKGLSPRVANRFDTMTALVDALHQGLARGPWRSGRRWIAASSVALLGCTAAAVHTQPAEDPCAAVAVPAAWTDATVRKIRSSLIATELPMAGDTADRVMTRLAAWNDAWQGSEQALCRHELAARSELEPHDLAHAVVSSRAGQCMAQARAAFDGVVDALQHADLEVTRRAVAAIAELPRPQECRSVPRPTKQTDASQASVRVALARAQALASTGAHASALRLFVHLRSRTETLDNPTLSAQVLAARGTTEAALGWHATAERSLTEAFWVATDADDPVTAGHAATELVQVVGIARARPQAALRWSQRALDAQHGTRSVQWLRRVAAVHQAQGNAAQATTMLQEASSAARPSCRASTVREQLLCADVTVELGRAMVAHGDVRRGRDTLDRARTIHQRLVGPQHPQVAADLLALGRADRVIGAHAESVAELAQAAALRSAALGVDLSVAEAQRELAETLTVWGHTDRARVALRAALVTMNAVANDTDWTATVTDVESEVALLVKLGRLDLAERQLVSAAAQFRKGANLLRERVSDQHPAMADLQVGLGDVARLTGDVEEARTRYNDARRIELSTGNSYRAAVAEIDVRLGQVELHARQPEAAAEHFDRALRLQQQGHVSADQRGQTWLGLAQARLDADAPLAAVDAAAQAIGLLSPDRLGPAVAQAHCIVAQAVQPHDPPAAQRHALRAQTLRAPTHNDNDTAQAQPACLP